MKNERSRLLIEELVNRLPEQDKGIYREIAEFVLNLGYRPKKVNKDGNTLDFTKNSTKKKILKLGKDDFRLKFYANEVYSQKFKDGIQNVIEAFEGKYTGCYGCGRCGNNLQGYTYIYPDGRKIFRCGSELISIKEITSEDIPEIKQLIAIQDEFFHNLTQKV